MRHSLGSLLLRWAVLAVGVALSAAIVPGISYDDGTTLLLVVVLLGLFNAFLKPLLVLFTLPFVLLTLGVGVWLINAFLLYGTGRLVEGFQVAGVVPALLGSLIISLTNVFLSGLMGKGPRVRVRGSIHRGGGAPPPERRLKKDDAIDI